MHRAQLEQSPSAAHDGSRQIAAHVAPALAFHFVADGVVAPIGFGDPDDAGNALKRSRRVGAVGVHLHVQRLRPPQPGGQVVRRVFGDHAALVDDDDALAGLRDFREDVRAQDDGVVPGQLLDQVPGLDDLLRIEARGRLVEDQNVGVVDDGLCQADALAVAL